MAWYYARGGQQRGPVQLEKLVAAAKAGKLRPDDSVWTEGMAEWKPAGQVPEIGFGTSDESGAPTPVESYAALTPVATATSAPAEVSYYSDRSGMPGRAAANLNGFALPIGDVGVWPLDDAQVAHWTDACNQRRAIRSAHGLFRGLCALNIIVAVIIGVSGLFAVANSRNGTGPAIALGVAVVFMSAFAVLFGLAASATRRNQVWAPITIAVLIGLGTVIQLASMGMAMASGGRDVPAAVGTGIISLALNVGFLVISLRAIPAIKQFRATPAWCQELTAAGKL